MPSFSVLSNLEDFLLACLLGPEDEGIIII